MKTWAIFICSFIAVTYGRVTSREKTNEIIDYTLCTTQDCVDVASKISAKLNPAVDPCDNFFQFACGKWLDNNIVNKSYPMAASMVAIKEKTARQIKDILEDSPTYKDSESLAKARRLYAMCMDVEKLENIGIKDLNKFVLRNGGWPITMSNAEWYSRKFTQWQDISSIIQRNMLYTPLYHVFAFVDDKESDKHVITVLDPTFFVPREVLINIGENSTQKELYKSYIQQVAKIFIEEKGAYLDDATIAQDALDIVNFEIELAKLTMPYEDFRNIDNYYNHLTIAELQKMYDAQGPVNSKINWLRVFRRLFASQRIRIRSSEKLVVQAYNYFSKLVPLLERTPSHVIVNYMQWDIIRDYLMYGDSRTERIGNEIAKEFQAEKQHNERWKQCVENSNLNTAISYEYVKRYVRHENTEEINNIVADIKDVVRGQISASTWMDNSTKQLSLEKIDTMKELISAPDWYSKRIIDRYYNKLIVTNSYVDSITNIFKFRTQATFSKLRKPVRKSDWQVQPTMVNAFHDPVRNVIIITASIMQDPVYDGNRPTFMNYASLGFVVGHEINHGFDNLGRRFDKNGNSMEWWTQDTIDKYEQLTQCFVDQYGSYQVPGLDSIYVNGQLSLGENIGDNAGIVAAYHAYKNRIARLNEPEMRLPGLEQYSQDQIFFMNFAHVFCEKYTPHKALLLLENEHLRGETRIHGSLSNFPEFSAAYNCPAGKRLNPTKKCILWQ